jgi:uncharacterized protein
MTSEITEAKLTKYFEITEKALELAKSSNNRTNLTSERSDFLDMIERYISDAHHFSDKKDKVNAFAALNYAHGWLDAGARLGIFDVHNSTYFTVDDE